MSPKARALIGVVTTLAFGTVGVSLLLSQRTVIGAVLIGLALLRASYAVRQVRDAFSDEA